MSDRPRLLFLSWDCPWPAIWGGAVRTLGLVTELRRAFDVELLLLMPEPLSEQRRAAIAGLSDRITCVPMRGGGRWDKARVLARSMARGLPYHSSVVEASFETYPDLRERILSFPGVVFASHGHWGALIHRRTAPNWVIDQQHEAAHIWRVYASQVASPALKIAALVNWQLARHHFKDLYPRVGRIISVCEEDRALTLGLAKAAAVDIVENGIDCSYYAPKQSARIAERPPSLLFVGTAARRNVDALRRFVRQTLPRIRESVPQIHLTVAGELGPRARREFAYRRDMVFTGPLDDLRTAFRAGDVFVVPHAHTHGSQIKVALAMAMGMPIISTPQGIRGLPLVDGESVLIARNDAEFAAHVMRVVKDASLRTSLGTAARRTALARLDWRVLGARVSHIVETVARAGEDPRGRH